MKKIEAPDVVKILRTRRALFKSNVSPLHEFVLKARTELKEEATEGTGSFGFYLGMLKKIPLPILYQFLAESKGAKIPLRNFWWRVGHYKKELREANAPYKIGDIVRITKGPENKVGKEGKVMTIAQNGVIMQLGPNMFTVVQFKHLEKV